MSSRSKAVRAAVLAAGVLLAAWAGAGASMAAGSPRVLVTLKPVHALVAAVMAGAGTPELLLDGAASPHVFALRPSDARRLQQAELIVRVAPTLETFLERPLAALSVRPRVVTLTEIAGMGLLALRGGEAFAAAPAPAARHGHVHDHEGGIDGHLWLDPANARRIGLAMAEELARLDPAQADLYRANAARLVSRLEALEQRTAEALRPVAGRRYFVFHDAYQYFETRFGLAAAGAIAISPEVPASAKRITDLRARLVSQKVVCVFAEPQFPPRLIAAVIEGTSVRQATLDPLGAAIPAGPEMYFALIDGLARDLKGCLAG